MASFSYGLRSTRTALCLVTPIDWLNGKVGGHALLSGPWPDVWCPLLHKIAEVEPGECWHVSAYGLKTEPAFRAFF